MSTPPQRPGDADERADVLAAVSVEPDFDYSWLSKEPPGDLDVAQDGEVIESGDEPPSRNDR